MAVENLFNSLVVVDPMDIRVPTTNTHWGPLPSLRYGNSSWTPVDGRMLSSSSPFPPRHGHGPPFQASVHSCVKAQRRVLFLNLSDANANNNTMTFNERKVPICRKKGMNHSASP